MSRVGQHSKSQVASSFVRRAAKAAGAVGGAAMLLAWHGTSHAGTVTRTSAFVYDDAGLVTKEIIEPGNSELCVVSVYEYDGFGNRKKATTRNCDGSSGTQAENAEAAAPAVGSKALFTSRSATTNYGTTGQFPTTTTNALNQSENRTYDERFGVVKTLTGPNGLTTYWSYDDLGRKLMEQRADGTGTRWSYEYCSSVTINGTAGTASCYTVGGIAATMVITVTPVKSANAAANTDGGATGPYTKTYSDGLGRIIRTETQGFDGTATGGTTTAKLIWVDTEYNALGQVKRKSRPYFFDAASSTVQWTAYTYDKLGRVIQETGPDGGISKVDYGGLTVKATNAKNQTRTETRNVAGQLTTITDAYGKTLTRKYDELGNLVQTTDALGNVTKLEYDLKGRKTKMIDPDMGMWTYAYNALGELVQQTDAKSQVATMTYDVLGRMTARSEPSVNSNWYYDQYKDGTACDKGKGKLCEVSSNNGYGRKHYYDSLARGYKTDVSISGTVYTSTTAFEADTASASYGRIKDVTYPSGLKLAYTYTPLGFHQQVVNAVNTSAVYWRREDMDAEGHLLRQSYGNSVVTTQTFDPATGLVKTIKAGTGGANQVQDANYTYDSIGNLTSQGDAAVGASATYAYDDLNRLLSETRLGTAYTTGQTISWTYDDIGNIKTRSDVGTYSYPASGATSVRPHAVSLITGTVNGVTNPSYSYDANGNITSSAGRSLTWTSANRVNTVTRGVNELAYWYDSEGDRIKETTRQNGSLQKTTIYLNPAAGAGLFYEEEIAGSTTKKKHYITAGGATIGVLIFNTATNGWTTQYWHKDHLGSTVAVTDSMGAVIERMAYEPFGKRRNVNGQTDLLATLAVTSTERGFTGHEMMDEVGLVNMNGRIYDPAIGRFLSADPYIQASDSLQSQNRYSYVSNNPLNTTDPTGYWGLKKLIKTVLPVQKISDMVTKAVMKVTFDVVRHMPGQRVIDKFIMKNEWAYQLGQIAAAVYGGPEGAALYSAYYTYLATGSISAGYKAGLNSYATAIAFNLVGSAVPAGSSPMLNALGHAAVGCASAAASGGDCGQGAAGAFMGALGSNYGGSFGRSVYGAALFGGLGAVATGGDFGQGAIMGAMGHIFNCQKHNCEAMGAAKEATADGRLTIGEANEIGRLNTDPNLSVTVDASKLSIVLTSPVDAAGMATARVTGYDWLTHGGVAVRRLSDGTFAIMPERYNFEMHTVQQHNNSVMATAARNFETIIGGAVARNGNKYQSFVGFNVNFSGSAKNAPQ